MVADDDRLAELEQEAWGGFLDTHTRLWRELETGLATAGLTMAEYDVLVALEAAGSDGVRMADLAARRLMSTGGFTRMADRLEGRGLIERRRSTVDGRGFDAVMTASGKRLLMRARRRHLGDVRTAFVTRLRPEDLRALIDIWHRLDPNDNDDARSSC